MKKKLYMLLGAVVVLGILFGVYVYMTKTPEQNTDENAQISMEDMGTQITKAKDVKNFSLKNSEGTFNFNKKGDNWNIEGYDSDFDSSVISNISSVFTSLYAEETIDENAVDISKYGLSSPAATGVSGDVSVNVGSLTADGKYYYVNINGGNTVYMVNSARIEPMLYGLDNMINKALPKIDTNSVQEISVDYSDDSKARDILIKYDKDNPIAKEYSEKNGLATLVMEKPVNNMLVYPYNLQSSILMNADSINIGSLVDIKPDNLEKYGLSSPVCKIYLADRENSVSINVGNVFTDNETELAYVMLNDRPEVFTMEYRALKPFVNASIADFVEKFISLYQRSKVESITIEGSSKYDIQFKAEGENDYRDIDGVKKDYRNTYINNKLVDKDAFTDFYELLIGIGFDDVVDRINSEDSAEITVTFNLTDGSKEVDRYYNYNDNFYYVNKDEGSSMLVSKQTVRKVLGEAEKLSK